jgi:hypothetical protein
MSSEKPFGIKDKMGRELSLEQAKQVPVWRLPFPNSFQLEEGVVCLIHPKVEGYYGSLLSKSCRHGSGWAYNHDNGGTHFGKEYVFAYGQQVSPIQTVFGTKMELPRWLIEEVIPREYCNADGSLNIVDTGDDSYVDDGKVLEGKPFVEVKETSEGEYFIWLPDMDCMSGSLSERIFSKNKGLSSMHFKKDGTLLSFCYNKCFYDNDDVNHEKFVKEFAAEQQAKLEKEELLQKTPVTTSDGQSIELPKWFADALTEDEKQRLLSDPGLVQKTGIKPVLTYSSSNTIGLRKPDGFFYTKKIFDAVIDFNNDSPEKGLEKLEDYRKYVETNHVDDYKKIQEALKKTAYSTLYASFAIVASKPSDMITYHFYQDGKSLKEVYYRDSKGNLHNKIGPAFIEYGLNGLVKQEEFWLNGTKFANEDEWNKALVKSKQAKEEANKTENLEQEQSEKKDSSATTIDNSLGGAAAAAGGLTMLAGVATLADKPSETTKSKGANTPVNMTMEKVKAIAISDSREVAKRIAVEKVSTIIRDLLINTMTANLKGKKKSQMMQTLATFFASEVGVATIQFMSGIGLPYIAPYLPEKYRGVVDEVSKELRIQGETKAAIEALGTIQPMIMMMVNGAMGSLSSLDAFVDETPVRVVTSAPATAHKEEEFAEVETASVAAIKKA